MSATWTDQHLFRLACAGTAVAFVVAAHANDSAAAEVNSVTYRQAGVDGTSALRTMNRDARDAVLRELERISQSLLENAEPLDNESVEVLRNNLFDLYLE